MIQKAHDVQTPSSGSTQHYEALDEPPPYTEMSAVPTTALRESEGLIPTSSLGITMTQPYQPRSADLAPATTPIPSSSRSHSSLEPDTNRSISSSIRLAESNAPELAPPPSFAARFAHSSTPQVDNSTTRNPTLLWPHQGPTYSPPSNQLARPIAIPTSRPALEAPFIRAYPTVLNDYHLPKDVFLRLLDELNDIKLGAPPLQVLGSVAGVVGFVPSQIAQIVSGSVQAATTVTQIAMSKGRTELWLRDINRQVFQPRGLKMEIAKLSALAEIAGMQEVLNEDGKVAKQVRLLQPQGDLQDDESRSSAERRLSALEPWIAHLELEPMPENVAQEMSPLQKFNAAISSRKEAKQEKKTIEERVKAGEKHTKEMAKNHKEFDKEMSKLDREEEKARRKESKHPKKMEEELRKIEKERTKKTREFEKEVRKVDKDLVKDDKEEEQFRKLTFLIIRDLRTDNGAGEAPVL